MFAVVDFLSSREKAMLIWGVVVTVYVWRKDNSIGGSLVGVLRSMFAPKLSLLWLAATTYCSAIVLAAKVAGLWPTTATKETIYWFLCTGAVLTGNVTTARSFDRAFVKQLARKALRLTIIVEFLVGVYVMPLAAELVVVPVVALFAMMQVVAENDPNLTSVKKLLDRISMLIGFGLMAWVIVSALTDLDALATRDHAEGLLLVPAFTLALVPFLYAVWKWSRWDQDRIMRRWRESKVALHMPDPESITV